MTGGEADVPVRQRILRAATAELAARGYAEASLETVAAAAGVTKPMVHYYFGSKAGLYQHAMSGARARLAAALAEAASAHGTDPLEAVVALLETASGLPAELALLRQRPRPEPAAAPAPSLEAPAEPARGLEPAPLVQLLCTAVRPLLEAARERGEVRSCDTEVVAAMLTAALAPGGTGDRAAWARRVAGQLWRGLGTGRPEPR